MTRSSWHVRVSGIVLGWLLVAGAVALFHRQVSAAPWLLVHLLLLGAVTNALFIWTSHFSLALLRLPDPGDRHGEIARLALLNTAVVTITFGVVLGRSAVVVGGAILLTAALLAHVIMLLGRVRRALPSRFAMTVHAYVAAAILLLPGIALGVGLVVGAVPTGQEARWVLAHAAIALFGWIGIPVLATVVTLWPTMLRTRIAPGAERSATAALPWLVGGTVITAAGALVGVRPATTLGAIIYLFGAVMTAVPLIAEARQRGPRSFPAWSVSAGLTWLLGSLVVFAVISVAAHDWESMGQAAGRLTAAILVGSVLQILLGSLAYLLPVMSGGGPAAVRWRNTRTDTAMATRLVALNLGLLFCVLPTPSVVRVIASTVVLVAAFTTAGLLLTSMRTPPDPQTVPESAKPAAGVAVHSGGIVVGVGAVLLAVAGGVAIDPAAVGTTAAAADSAAAGVSATGNTTTADITVTGMRFTPATIAVPAGDRLVINLHNTGDDRHDLVLDTGQQTPRLDPGQRAQLDVGIVGRPLEGWCSVAGHRQMGMVLDIQVIGAAPVAADRGPHDAHDYGSTGVSGVDPSTAPEQLDLMAEPGADWMPRSATLPPAGRQRVHRIRMVASEQVQEVAPGVTQTRWTFNGTAPGPTLHGRVGDRFVITLINDGTIGHSIDFHAGALAPDRPMRTIQPGEQLTYRFTAERAGAWMYHCGTMPMSMHIANGMFGAVIIDPPGLSEVEREYVLVQSESYLGEQGGTADATKIAAGGPDLVTFNGYPMQYDHRPLLARAGDRVRIWVVDAGPNEPSSFHVVGGQFDTVYSEGRYLIRDSKNSGSQALALLPAQGGFVEFDVSEPGHYPFVSHIMSDAERGAHGVLLVR